jgi:hypothetical protein
MAVTVCRTAHERLSPGNDMEIERINVGNAFAHRRVDRAGIAP